MKKGFLKHRGGRGRLGRVMESTPGMAEEEIRERLRGVRWRMRRAQAWRGAMVVATVALGGLVVMMGIDLAVSPLPGWLRWAMFVAWVAAVGWAMRAGFTPLLQKIGLVQVARWIEARHPEMQERMSTVLELSGGGGGGSAELLGVIGREAAADAGTVDAQGEVRAARTSPRWARPAGVLAAGLLAALVVWPGEAGRLLVRAVVPFSDAGNAGASRFVITPGDLEVMAGERIEISAGYKGAAAAATAVIELVMADGAKISQAMERVDGGFSYVLDPARQGFRYRVRMGRVESDAFQAHVWPLPKVVEPRKIYEYPEYTGWLRSEVSLGRGVEALVGTRVEIHGGLNTAVESARLEVDGKVVANGRIEESANGGRVSFGWTLEAGASGEARVVLRHRLGREVEALGFPVDVLEDQVPVVSLLSPRQAELMVRPDELLVLRYEVVEDVGLAGVWVEVDAGGDGAGLLEVALPEEIAGSRPPRSAGEAAWAVGAIRERFRGTKDFRLRIKARDGRPAEFAGPGEGFSDWLRIRIDEGAESLARQELRQEHDGAREEVDKALRDIREARDRMARQGDAVRKEELEEHARKDLEEAAGKLAAAEEVLKELVPQMEAGIHATKADETRKALEAVAESREELEAAPLQDESVQRAAKLDQAKALAEAAIQALEQAREEIERDQRKVDELAQLQDLAQRQQELARQAEAIAQAPEAAKDEDWRRRQEQVREEIREQVRQRPDARAEALLAQAEEARELAEQARELADNQQALREQAAAVAEEPPAAGALEEALQNALADAQAEIAREAAQATAQAQQERSPVANSLPEAAQAANEAAEQIQNEQAEAAADAASEAAAAMRESAAEAAALAQPADAAAADPQANAESGEGENGAAEPAAGEPAGNPLAEAARAEELTELAARQEQVAEAMQALADGDPAAALQALQEAQAAAAGELAGAVEEAPQVDPGGAMNEAAQAASEGAGQAETAAEQGKSGNLPESAARHGEASGNLARAANALERAANEAAAAAEQAAGQPTDPSRAPVPPQDLAEAFQEAAQAAAEAGSPAESAQQAAQAAAALTRSARQARAAMQGRPLPQPGQPGPAGDPSAPPQPGEPGQRPQEGPQQRQADPGVPPELAKLGISAADWEKIQSTLKSEVGSAAAGGVPEEYRDLVKGYFENLSKSGK